MDQMLSDPRRLLAAWEHGAALPPVARGAAVVAAADLAPSHMSALELPLGNCATLAIRAHVASFGRVVTCAATCHSCAELIELVLDLADLPAAEGSETSATVAEGAVIVRALTTRDLIDAGAAEDPRALLLDRCGVDEVLDPAVEAAVEEAAERLAGVAGIVLHAVCPGCGTAVRVGFDPGLLLWEQVAAAAERLLAEVAELAAAYGWTERDVLRLSPRRRAAYLELARR